MKTENEKTIEQEALENYASNKTSEAIDRILFSAALFMSLITSVYSVYFFWNQTTIMGLLFIALVFGTLTFVLFGTFPSFYFDVNSSSFKERQIMKIIINLSEDEKQKIITKYIQETIDGLESDTIYDEEDIIKKENEIEILQQTIRETKDKIVVLQKKLIN